MINRKLGILYLITTIFILLIVFLIDFAPKSWAEWGISMNSPTWMCFIGQGRDEPFSNLLLAELGILLFLLVWLIKKTKWSGKKSLRGK